MSNRKKTPLHICNQQYYSYFYHFSYLHSKISKSCCKCKSTYTGGMETWISIWSKHEIIYAKDYYWYNIHWFLNLLIVSSTLAHISFNLLGGWTPTLHTMLLFTIYFFFLTLSIMFVSQFGGANIPQVLVVDSQSCWLRLKLKCIYLLRCTF